MKHIILKTLVLLSISSICIGQSGNWTHMGPYNGLFQGSGVFTDLQMANDGTIYAASPLGGLYKSTNNGGSWTRNGIKTDYLKISGVSCLAINPIDANEIYIASSLEAGSVGEPYEGDNSAGIYKTTDGGASWYIVKPFSGSERSTLYSIAMNQSNPNIVIVGASNGIYRTADGGCTWSGPTVLYNQNPITTQIMFDTRHSNIVYACGKKVFKSTDFGVTWTDMNLQDNPENSSVITMAMSPLSDNFYVMAYYITGDNDGTAKFYRYKNNAWEKKTDNIDIHAPLGKWPTKDKIYVDPITPITGNSERLYFCSNYLFISNGWNSPFTTGSGDRGFSNPDFQCMLFYNAANTNDVLFGCDGGVFRGFIATDFSSMGSLIDRNTGISVVTMTYFDVKDNTMAISKWHTACNYFNGTNWVTTSDPGEKRRVFLWSYSGIPYYFLEYTGEYSTDNTTAFYNTGSDLIVRKADPTQTSATMGLHKPVYDFVNKRPQSLIQGIDQIVTYEADPNIMYVSCSSNKFAIFSIETGAITSSHVNTAPGTGGYIFKTINGGTTWTDVTEPGLGNYGNITSIAISNTDHNKIWVSIGFGNNPDYLLRYSSNGGTTWTSANNGFWNANDRLYYVMYERNSMDRVYVGSAYGGVYSKSKTESGWTKFNCNLPNGAVMKLKYNSYDNNLYAGLSGYGVWRSPLICDAQGVDITATYPTYPNGWTGISEILNYYRGSNSVTSNTQIPAGLNNVLFKATNLVKLSPGFKSNGLNFKATTAPCAPTPYCENNALADKSIITISTVPDLAGANSVVLNSNVSVVGNPFLYLTNPTSFPNGTIFKWYQNGSTPPVNGSGNFIVGSDPGSAYYFSVEPHGFYGDIYFTCRAYPPGGTCYTYSNAVKVTFSFSGSKLADSTFLSSDSVFNTVNTTTGVVTRHRNNGFQSQIVVSNKSNDNLLVDNESLDPQSQGPQDVDPYTIDRVSVYPNPTQGRFYIQKQPNTDPSYDLYINDVNGKQILSKNGISSDLYEVDLEGKPNGSYFIKVTDKKGARNYKIIIDSNPGYNIKDLNYNQETTISNKSKKQKAKKSN